VAVGVAILMVVLAAVGARLRRMPSTTALALRSLVVVRGAAPVRPPVALLYVDRACPHCRPAALRFDSLARTARVPAFIVSTDRLDSAAALARYADALGVGSAGLALDTGHLLAHAARLRAVPVVVLVDRLGQVTVTYGAPVRLTRTRDSP
jgi:hypothetical protein